MLTWHSCPKFSSSATWTGQVGHLPEARGSEVRGNAGCAGTLLESSTQEPEAGGPLSLRPAWSTQPVLATQIIIITVIIITSFTVWDYNVLLSFPFLPSISPHSLISLFAPLQILGLFFINCCYIYTYIFLNVICSVCYWLYVFRDEHLYWIINQCAHLWGRWRLLPSSSLVTCVCKAGVWWDSRLHSMVVVVHV